MKNSEQIVGRLLAMFVLLMVAGCGSTGDSDPDWKLFRYNQASGIRSLDPAYASNQANIWAVNQLYNGLVQLDEELQLQPCIARSWGLSPDGLEYTFQLRTDVHFHDSEVFAEGKGRLMTAEDVVYSLGRLIDPSVASPGSWIFNGRVDTVLPFTALNDSTFRLRLMAPFPPILSILSMQYCSVVPREAVEFYGTAFRANPVGTGPFRMKVWQEDNALFLLKNGHYFEEDAEGNRLPHIDAVRVSFMDSKKTEYLSFRKGELDFISGIDPSFLHELFESDGSLRRELADSFRILRSPYLNTEYLGFNLEGNPPAAEVRRAINLGFDRAAMIRQLRFGFGIPATAGFTPPGLAGALDAGFHSYDPDSARKLMRLAGYSAENPAALMLLTNESYRDIALYLSEVLRGIYIDLQVEVVQSSLLREWMRSGEADFFRGSWIADYPDAESYLAVFKGGLGAPPNYTRHRSERFDSAYAKALIAESDSARYLLYREMDAVVMRNAAVVPLFYDEVLRISRPNTSKLGVNPLNLLILKHVRM